VASSSIGWVRRWCCEFGGGVHIDAAVTAVSYAYSHFFTTVYTPSLLHRTTPCVTDALTHIAATVATPAGSIRQVHTGVEEGKIAVVVTVGTAAQVSRDNNTAINTNRLSIVDQDLSMPRLPMPCRPGGQLVHRLGQVAVLSI
jgi:hypothetical protein